MIHIATVHHLTDKWIDIQLKYIEKNIKSPHRIYAFLNGIKKDYSQKFYFSSTENIIEHAEKLNILAQKICETAKDSDLIMFIDGDAFPIQEMDAFLEEKLNEFPMLAIRRKIDFGVIFPHPSFCVMPVGLWRKIKGDWRKGYICVNSKTNKKFTDVGANLYKLVLENNINWYPMDRNNKHNIHPRWFGVYDGIVYHHGAGFGVQMQNTDLRNIQESFNSIEKILSKIIFVRRFFYRNIIKKHTRIGNVVFNSILKDDDFYKQFI